MRHSFMGCYDRSQAHGEITGSGPGFEDAMSKYRERQRRYHQVGRWRAGRNGEKFKSDGTYIDPEYYVVDQMGNYIDGSILDEVFDDSNESVSENRHQDN